MRMAVALLAAAMWLNAAGGVEFWSAADLKATSDRLSASQDARNIAGKTLGAYGSHSASFWRRGQSGQAELHKTKVDLIVVEEGSATLRYGGAIPDARTTAPNEVRGTSIRGGESRKIEPGDIIRIPAGTPHQFVLEKGQSVGYFALKIAR